MPREGWRKLPKIDLVPIPDNVHVPDDIPASKVLIPSTYTGLEVEYEDDEGNHVDEIEQQI